MLGTTHSAKAEMPEAGIECQRGLGMLLGQVPYWRKPASYCVQLHTHGWITTDYGLQNGSGA